MAVSVYRGVPAAALAARHLPPVRRAGKRHLGPAGWSLAGLAVLVEPGGAGQSPLS